MKKYIRYMSFSMQETFMYRSNYFVSLLITVLSISIVLCLWHAIYSSGHSDMQFSETEMIIYILSSNIILRIVDTASMCDAIIDDIKDGRLSAYLLRPISYIKALFFKTIGNKVVTIPIIFVGYCFMLFLYQGFFDSSSKASLDWRTICVSIFFIIGGALCNFFLDYLVGLTAFWIENPFILSFLKSKALPILCGGIIPLNMLPNGLNTVFQYLPFKIFAFVPAELLVSQNIESVNFKDGYICLFWIVALAILSDRFFKKSVRQYSAVGG